MKKPVVCKQCGVMGHYRYQCRFKPPKKKKKTPPKKKFTVNKNTDFKWLATRKKWFKANPPIEGYYYCHYCSRVLVKNDVLNDYGVGIITLDHKVNRRNTALKYDISNLVPACFECNSKKGSRSYESFCAEFAPHLLELDSRE